MTTFTISCKLHRPEDQAAFDCIMEAWEGQRVMESTWILKRNDGCTCQTVIDDLLEHIYFFQQSFFKYRLRSIITMS